MTTAEAADALGITPRRVRALIASGRLKARRYGRDWSISEEAIEAVRERPPGRPRHST